MLYTLVLRLTSLSARWFPLTLLCPVTQQILTFSDPQKSSAAARHRLISDCFGFVWRRSKLTIAFIAACSILVSALYYMKMRISRLKAIGLLFHSSLVGYLSSYPFRIVVVVVLVLKWLPQYFLIYCRMPACL